MVIVFLSGTTLILGDHCNTIRDDATKYKGKRINKFGPDPLHKRHTVVTIPCSDIHPSPRSHTTDLPHTYLFGNAVIATLHEGHRRYYRLLHLPPYFDTDLRPLLRRWRFHVPHGDRGCAKGGGDQARREKTRTTGGGTLKK